MSTGVPRDYHKVVKAAKELGYQYSYSTGGHDFFVHPHPDKDLEQAKKLTIPTEIKGTGTLRNILKGMGYFAANGLDHSGQPRSVKKDIESDGPDKIDSRFIVDTRGWKKEMKRHARGIADHPGAPPVMVTTAPKSP